MTEAEPVALKPPRRKMFRTLRKMRRLALLLWPHARSHKGLLLIGALISITLIGLRLAQPWPLKWIVDVLSNKHHTLHWLQLQPDHAIVLLSLSYIGVSLLAGLADYWQQILLAGLGNRIIFSFRNQAFSHLLRLPLSYHEKRTPGELVTRIVYDTARLRRGVNGILIRTFQVVFTFLLNVVVILQLNWRIAIVIGVFGTLALLIMNRNGKRILFASCKNRRREGQLAAIVDEDVHGVRELQTFKPGCLTDERFEHRNVKSLSNEQKVRRLEAGLSTQVEILLAVGICVVLWIGGMAVRAGELGIGSLVLISHYAVGLFGPFRQFARQAAQTGRTMACAERLTKIMDKETSLTDMPDAMQLLAPPQVIRFSEVSVKSSSRQRVTRKWMLNNISCEIRNGERVGVVGKNGAGKSTLIKLLLRLADPQQGSIEFDGKDIKQFTLSSLRSQFSAVFQDNVFFGLTLRENIALGNPHATTEEIEHVAAQCGIDQWIARLKKGLETQVHRQGTLFSGGEKQKIAIARALLRNGDIWLLDEPTNDLDETSRETLVRLLIEATEQRTTLWVTHDRDILQYCMRVLLLEEGKIAFLGTPREFSCWLEENPDEQQVLEQLDYKPNLKEGE